MITLGFVVPLKAKANSRDWEHDERLLARTLSSLAGSGAADVAVFVVHTDPPRLPPFKGTVRLVRYPYEFLTSDRIADYETYGKRWFDPQWAARAFDQGKRVLYGCRAAREAGCRYVMAVDADDLVSCRVTDWVRRRAGERRAGWFVDQGYIYREGSRLLLRQYRGMADLNASTHIVRMDLVPAPDFSSTKLADFNFFAAHGWLRHRLRGEQGESLEPLPFYANVYCLHGQNWAGGRSRSFSESCRTALKSLVRGRFISARLRSEFGLNPLSRFNPAAFPTPGATERSALLPAS